MAGASAWVSAATLAVTPAGDRLAMLPSWWLLAAAVVAGPLLSLAVRLTLGRAWPLAIAAILWLPYLPVPVPASFLLWQGPLEWGVWFIVIAGMVGPSLAQLPAVTSNPRVAPWLAAVMTAASSLLVFTGVHQVVPGGDEPHYLVATESLLADADLKIENNYAAGGYLAYFSGRLEPHYLRRSTAGEIYSIHSPGLSLLMLPGFAVAGYSGAVGTMVVVSAATAALTWHTAWLLSASAAGAWIGCLVVFLTSPFVFHSFTIYPDGAGALPTMAGVWLLVQLERGRAVGTRSLVAVGFALAVLPWLHSRFVLLAAGLGLALAIRLATGLAPVRRLTSLLALPAASAIGWFVFFWIIWGIPSPSAPYGGDTNSSIAYLTRGVTGLLIDQQYGLLATAPAYVVALGAGWLMVRNHPRLLAEFALVTLPYIATVSAFAMWWAGTSAPARFLVPLLPIASLLIAVWWPRQSRAARALLLLLLTVSVGLAVPRAAVDAGQFAYTNRSGRDLTIDWLARSADLSLALPGVHRDDWLTVVRDAAPWFAGVIGLLGLAYALNRRPLDRAATWTWLTGAAGVVAMLATSAVWALHGVSGVTPERSELAALSAYRPAWHRVVLDLGTRRTVTPTDLLDRMELASYRRSGTPRPEPITMVRLAKVPAGEYLLGAGGAGLTGQLSMSVGRNDPPIEAWGLQDGGARTVSLPVGIASLIVRGDRLAAASVATLGLRAAGVASPANNDGRYAVRAARYGRARVFFFDERAYLEPSGFWTRADETVSVVIDADEAARAAGLPIVARAGAVSTTVEFAAGGWRQTLTLAAGQRAVVTLPPLGEGNAWAVSIRSGAGFRPSQHEPGRRDVRALSAWIEIP